MQSIDTVSFSILRESMGDDFRKLIVTYIDTSQAYIDTISDLSEEGHYQKMIDAAHPLKSSSAALGLVELSEISAEIERLTDNDDLNEADMSRVKDLSVDIVKSFEEVKSFLLSNLPTD